MAKKRPGPLPPRDNNKSDEVRIDFKYTKMLGFMFAHKSGVTTFKAKMLYRKQVQPQNTLLGPGCSSVLNSIMMYNWRLETCFSCPFLAFT